MPTSGIQGNFPLSLGLWEALESQQWLRDNFPTLDRRGRLSISLREHIHTRFDYVFIFDSQGAESP